MPLLPAAPHYVIASTLASDSDRLVARLLGDPLVTWYSANGRSLTSGGRPLLPDAQVKILPGLGHLALAHHDDVYAQMLGWWEA